MRRGRNSNKLRSRRSSNKIDSKRRSKRSNSKLDSKPSSSKIDSKRQRRRGERVSQAPVSARDQQIGVVRVNSVAVVGVEVAAVLFKASIVAAARRGARANVAASAVEAVAAEPEEAVAADDADSKLLSSFE